jgi:hypothetical protein
MLLPLLLGCLALVGVRWLLDHSIRLWAGRGATALSASKAPPAG